MNDSRTLNSQSLKAQPLFIAVAPNGARYNKQHHCQLPLTPSELAQTAIECLEAGARMIHLHVRDESNRHSLKRRHYQAALDAVKDAVADNMLIQITSEAAGIYQAAEQIALMSQIDADCMSIALREVAPKSNDDGLFADFVQSLQAKGCLIQYILYDQDDFKRYRLLLANKVIPSSGHSLLFVLGRYAQSTPDVNILEQYQALLTSNYNDSANPWMVCTFGVNSQAILKQAAQIGCQLRVGFENGFYLPNGEIATDNAQLLQQTVASILADGRRLATIEEARIMMGQ